MALTLSIINTILADVIAIVPNFSSLVSSYRLLVGAAEEIHRTPDVPIEIFQRAVDRFDHAGALIDILLELLCCKISFSSDFLSVTCAPVDLYRLLSNRSAAADTSFHTAEQIVELEILRRVLELCRSNTSCFSPAPSAHPNPPSPSATNTDAFKPPIHQKENEVLDELIAESGAELFTEVNKEIE
ncbi:MAG: hypothetical protein ABFC57_02515 [Veillonellales bacterium]